MDRNQSQPATTNFDGTLQQQRPGKSTISVQSSGEVRLLPDVLHFTVSIRNSKETLEEAQTSVKRRTDYIAQVARKNGVKGNNIVFCTDVSQSTEGGTAALGGGQNSSNLYPMSGIRLGLAVVHTDVTVNCDSVARCEAIRNTLIEKLDNSVEVSPVSFMHSVEVKEKARQEAFKRAVTSAKAKAECIVQTVGVQLGSAIEVKEIQQDCLQGPATEQVPDLEASAQSAGLHQRHLGSSLAFVSNVSICFETHSARICSHKKCRKH